MGNANFCPSVYIIARCMKLTRIYCLAVVSMNISYMYLQLPAPVHHGTWLHRVALHGLGWRMGTLVTQRNRTHHYSVSENSCRRTSAAIYKSHSYEYRTDRKALSNIDFSLIHWINNLYRIILISWSMSSCQVVVGNTVWIFSICIKYTWTTVFVQSVSWLYEIAFNPLYIVECFMYKMSRHV